MTKKKVLALAIVGVFILASAGIVQAGGWMHKSSGYEKPAKQEMETVYAPEFEEGEYGGVIETGTLPPDNSRLLEIDEVPSWFDEPTTE
jgi:hypothetical protein